MTQILIIEDDPFVRRFYERLFRLNGFDITLAKNGEEGLKLAREIKPPLILLDIMMPDVNGLDVLQLLKDDPDTKDLEVIMLTNVQDIASAKRAAELGASAFVIKSNVTDEELISIANRHLPPKPNPNIKILISKNIKTHNKIPVNIALLSFINLLNNVII